MIIPKTIIVLLVSELIRFSLYANQVDKDLLHRIDDLLLRKISIAEILKEENNNFDINDKYNNSDNDIEYFQLLVNFFVAHKNILINAKKEIEVCCQEIDLLSSKYSKTSPSYDLIICFKDFFNIYKTYLRSMNAERINQIRTAEFAKFISLIELNQLNLFDALDNSDINTAQNLFDTESKYIESYPNYFDAIDFSNRIPKAWGNEFRNTYVKMHERISDFLEAKKYKNETLYEKLRFQGFDIISTIPIDKSKALKDAIDYIIFGSDPDIDILENKSLQAEAKALILYISQKRQIGEDPIVFDIINNNRTNTYFALTRKLVKMRIYSNPELKEIYSSGEVPRIENMSDWELMGIPEATIVTIIETYWSIKIATNKTDIEILDHIENERNILFPESTGLPTTLTLYSYIKYRLRIEHPPPVTQINDSLLKEMIDIANNVYGYKQ